LSQGASKDDLRRDRGRREEGDEPQPLDPAIVDRHLSYVEQPVIPFDDPRPHLHNVGSVRVYKTLSRRVSPSDIVVNRRTPPDPSDCSSRRMIRVSELQEVAIIPDTDDESGRVKQKL
jgi:hypothetical protein